MFVNFNGGGAINEKGCKKVDGREKGRNEYTGTKHF